MVWPFSKTTPDFNCLPNAIVDPYGVILSANSDFYKYFRCTNGMKVREVMQIRVINMRVFCLSELHHQWEMIYEPMNDNYKIWMAGVMPHEPKVWQIVRIPMLLVAKNGNIISSNEVFISELGEQQDVCGLGLTASEFCHDHHLDSNISGRRYKIICSEYGNNWLLAFERYNNEKSVASMVASVVHDFRNWLMIMDGYADMSRTDHSYIDHQKHTIQKAYKMVNDLLDLVNDCRQDRGVMNICEAMSKMTDSLQVLLGSVRIEVKVEPDMAYVRLSYVELEQILHNLLKNSKEAGCKSIRLTLRQRNFDQSWAINGCKMKSGRYIELAIFDDGQGVSEVLFGATTKTTGNGIGLQSIRQMLMNVGGGMVFISEDGSGAQARLYIPLVEGGMAELPASSNSAKIVLVEDNQDIRGMLMAALEKAGYDVVGFESAEEAIKHVPGDFDLLITDANLPGNSGAYLATRLREMKPNLQLLVISGMNQDTILPRFPSGAVFLCKPIPIARLLQEVAAMLPSISALG